MPKKAVGNQFLAKPLPTFFGATLTVGRVCSNQESEVDIPRPYYEHPHGMLWVGDCVAWMDSIRPGSVDLIFADPPYNIGKADWDKFESHDEYIAWSLRWIEAAARALKPTGSLYVCGFSEILADLRRPAAQFFSACKWLVWYYKNKANLGNNWGRSHESILHFRKGEAVELYVDDIRIPYGRHTLKYPLHPQAESSQYGNGVSPSEAWKPHPGGAKPKDVFEIPVTSNGMKEKTPHPTQKPEELLRRIVLASSREGDLVVDPFAGSGTTLVCAEQLRRKWQGCELNSTYCSWAVIRLESIPQRSVSEWIEFDRETARRRESIR